MKPRFLRLALVPSALLALTVATSAAVLQEWNFKDPEGTTLTKAANSAKAGARWNIDLETVATTGQGALRIRRTTSTAPNSFARIADVKSGTVWLQADFAGWNLTGTAAETVRIGFSQTAPTTGNPTMAAQVKLERAGSSKEVVLSGEALGAGSNVAETKTFPATLKTPLSVLLKFDKSANTYTISYKEGAGAWTTLGSGKVDPAREGRYLRLGTAGGFATSEREFFDIARIALTDSDPAGKK
jgi:hypothetical protein